MTFEFATAGRIVFGPGAVAELPGVVRALGERAFVITGRDTGRAARQVEALSAAGVTCTVTAAPREPVVAFVRAQAARARAEAVDVIVAIGGGSAIDAGKAIAAMATNSGDVLDYLEVVGHGAPLVLLPLPFVAVPTTAGTGAEVTRNAVLGVPEHRVKVSLRSPLMLPRVAIVDPDLARGLPPDLTASTGLDALTQLIEPFVSSRANPMVDAWCQDGIRCAAGALRAAYRDGHDGAARESMAFASLLGGLALANAGLGAVHGFAAPIGGRFEAPHGAVCAALLPHVCAMNIRALDMRAPGHPAKRRYDEVARIVTGRPAATAADGVAWIRDLVGDLGVSGLAAYGVGPDHVAGLVEAAMQASSMKANPISLLPDELTGILMAAL